MAMRLGLSVNPVRNLYHGFEKRGQTITRVTSTRLELDNKYREAKGCCICHIVEVRQTTLRPHGSWHVLLGAATNLDSGRVHVYVNL